jgi:hypothetical protein
MVRRPAWEQSSTVHGSPGQQVTGAGRKEIVMSATTLTRTDGLATTGLGLGGMQDLTARDRAVLRAVDAGRCRLSGPSVLMVDGLFLADPFAAPRLAGAGLIEADDPRSGAVHLTASGRAVLTS